MIPYPQSSQPEALLEWAKKLAIELDNRSPDGTGGSELPSGTIQPFIGTVVPKGWLELKGQVLERAEYATLFGAIGTRFNTGGESGTEFRLPDARGRVMLHSDDAYGGEGTAVLSLANLPAVTLAVTDPGHTHAFSGAPHTHGVTDPGHSHTVTGSPLVDGGSNVSVGSGAGSTRMGSAGAIGTQTAVTNLTVNNATAGGSNANASTGISVQLEGGGQAVDLIPPFFGGKWIVRT